MTKPRLFKEWPLAIFTFTLQITCGIALATTIAIKTSATPSATLRSLAIAVFPIMALGLFSSLAHLGRPLSAWRAFTNVRRSRLSLEVLFTSAFTAAAFAYSWNCWSGPSELQFLLGAIASVLGIAAVLSSAAIYEVAARPVWDSAFVFASFLGSTTLFSALALAILRAPSLVVIAATSIAAAVLLPSGAWMWTRFSRLQHRYGWMHSCFAGYLLLILSVPLLLILIPATGIKLACTAAAAGIFIGRFLMFAVAEFESPF